MIGIRFETNAEKYYADYMEVVREFEPHLVDKEGGERLFLQLESDGEQVKVIISSALLPSNYYEISQKIDISRSELAKIAQIKRFSKVALYDAVKKISGVDLPYGSLTGIRPTKLYHDLLSQGKDAQKEFEEDLRVSASKTKLIGDIVKNQSSVYLKEEGVADVFVNIPICPTRCVYCSFISAEFSKIKKQVPAYCDLLIKELEDCKKLIAETGYKIRSVYVGGGTPTCISDDDFLRILSLCDFGQSEFTVEAGRPDTITENKLKIMDETGVTRISINPQSFNQSTLDVIGRRHSVDDVYRAYECARKYSFDINTDLIAMLPGEGFDEFAHSVDCTVGMRPENITVHTLTLTRASRIVMEDQEDNRYADVAAMLERCGLLAQAGYRPYYLYRQKNTLQNLENVGWCKPGREGYYNIYIMEEVQTILSAGAGGSTKLVDAGGHRMQRIFNFKYPNEYIQRFDQVLERKKGVSAFYDHDLGT